MKTEQKERSFIGTLVERCKAETPSFFKKMRLIGLVLAAVGGVLVATPITLPTTMVNIAGYLILAGSVATAVSQVTVKDENEFEFKKKEY